MTSWAEQWPFCAKAQEIPFEGVQRLLPSSGPEPVPMSLWGLITCSFSQLQNHDVTLVAWTDHGGNIYITEISKLQTRLSPLQNWLLNIYQHVSASTIETVAHSMIFRSTVSEFPREKRRWGWKCCWKCRFLGQPELTGSDSLEGDPEEMHF